MSTLSLAVEWLLQAPQEARQGAMLHATELLLAFTLAPVEGAAGSSSNGWSDTAALEGSEAADAAPPATPLVSPAVGGARAGAQHRLAAAAPSPLQLPPSPASSPLGALSPGLPGTAQRPLSPSMMALQAAAAAAASGAAGSGAAAAAAAQPPPQQQERPGTPRASSFDRLQGVAETSAADLAASAGVALGPAPDGGGSSTEQLEAAAAAAVEAQATRLWSFLSGRAMVPQVLCMLLALSGTALSWAGRAERMLWPQTCVLRPGLLGSHPHPPPRPCPPTPTGAAALAAPTAAAHTV